MYIREEKIAMNILDNFYNGVPEKVRDKIKGKFFMAGGAISSIVTGEEINDYDIYFTDVDALVAYMEHATKDENDGVFDPTKVWRSEGDKSGMVLITDMNNEPINSYDGDLCKSHVLQGISNRDTVAYTLKDGSFLSANALSKKDGYQIIFRFVGEPENITNNFDFAHCMGYIKHDSEEGLVLPELMIKSVLSKTLNVVGTNYPIDSLNRSKKYISRGYRLDIVNTMKLVFAINDLDIRNPSVLKDQMIGIDASYLRSFVDAIDEKISGEYNPDPLCENYIFEIMQESFDQHLTRS